MLTTFSWIPIGIAVACAVVIALDEIRRPQRMGVMNVVWPATALYFSVFGVWAYFTFGRAPASHQAMPMSMPHADNGQASKPPPSLQQIFKGTSHCGAGCALADLLTDFSIAAWGFQLFHSTLVTEYVLDFIAAWALGIVFQYFAIRPMRPDLSPGGVVLAAIKADTLSILAFQVGMYLWMALVYFRLFPAPHHLTPFDPRYWLMMQVAMVCGFATSFPMNRALIRAGMKEAM